MFANSYYGGLRAAEVKSRLRQIKFAYRVDQKFRTTYKVRWGWAGGGWEGGRVGGWEGRVGGWVGKGRVGGWGEWVGGG